MKKKVPVWKIEQISNVTEEELKEAVTKFRENEDDLQPDFFVQIGRVRRFLDDPPILHL